MATETKKAYLSYYYSEPLDGFFRFSAWITLEDEHDHIAIDAISAASALALATRYAKDVLLTTPIKVEVFLSKRS